MNQEKDPYKKPEAKELESRMLLGELIFAFIVVCLDIGYAMSLLSCYAEYPANVRYTGLKSVTRYLRETKWRPIIYWRRKPMPNMQRGDFVPIMRPSTVRCSFPDDPYLVTAKVDASHATDSSIYWRPHYYGVCHSSSLVRKTRSDTCNFNY